MASYDVTAEVQTLIAAGWTAESLEKRVDRLTIYRDGTATAYNRGASNQIATLVAEAAQKAARAAANTAVAEGRAVQWRKVGAAWLLAGRDLTPGDVVTVTRRNGSSSEEIVGEIVAVKDGVTLARTGRIAARRDRSADRVAGMLGLPAAKADGRCHYCGLPLNARGYCDECC